MSHSANAPSLEEIASAKSRSIYEPRSRDVRYDDQTGLLEVRLVHQRGDEYGWLKMDLSEAMLPVSPVNSTPIKLTARPELCLVILATVDSYVLGSSSSKSTHVLASDIVRTLYKLFEYAWLQGFYRLVEMPREAWNSLAHKLIRGGWVNALEIKSRTAKLLSKPGVGPGKYLTPNRSGRDKRSVSVDFQRDLGTNIASRELYVPRLMIEKSIGSDEVRASGDVDKYELPIPVTSSATMIKQTLRIFNQLADIDEGCRLPFLPVPNAYAFAEKYGRKEKPTENLTPEVAARLLMHSFDWILEKGPAIADLIEALAEELIPLYTSDRFDANTESTRRFYISSIRNGVLRESPQRNIVEDVIGFPVTKFATKRQDVGGVSLYWVLNQLYSSCFVTLAVMNARRKDEIIHKAIGLHESGVRTIEEELELYECEFYVEKTVGDYEWFWIASICKKALDLLMRISKVAWHWADVVEGRPVPQGRDRKLFVYPSFAGDTRRGMLYFDFNANASGMSEEFIASALKDLQGEFRVTPHMFRRCYGLINHYVYENSTLASLARKYRHFNLVTPLHYVTNGSETPTGAHAASLWSAPGRTVLDGHREQAKAMAAEVQAVGREKFELFVQDIIAGEKRYSGGFAKLVDRFNRHLVNHLSYRELDEQRKSKALSDTLLSRGHMPHPYPHATCMAGATRRGAACSSQGHLARELASAVVCGACSYSVIVAEHIQSMEEEAERLDAMSRQEVGTLGGRRAATELQSLRRVIVLQKKRLGI